MITDADTCYRAAVARDVRFDGLFFVAVRTTGIYCRSVCPARKPRRENCRFFMHAAAAERAGYRPCLRCRPELAPGLAPMDARSEVARRAVARIQDGAMNGDGSLESLARELGVSSRHIRRAVQDELGATPSDLAKTQRLLLAKQLLTETRLPILEVAFASGFASLRRFNAAFLEHYRWSPTQLRRQAGDGDRECSLRLRLSYRPPLAWRELLAFLRRRAIGGVEFVDDLSYQRTVATGKHQGWLAVTHSSDDALLQVELSPGLTPVIGGLLPRLRNLFDLHAQPVVIDSHLGNDPRLSRSVANRPGLRVPGAFDGFELAWRAILGQQVSVAGATTLSARFAERFGEPLGTPECSLTRVTPSAITVATASEREVAEIGLPRSRARALREVACLAADRPHLFAPGATTDETCRALLRIKGLGPWTASYIAMRALSDPDAFLESDLVIRRVLDQSSEAQARRIAEPWRPWRAYAAMHLWADYPTKEGRHAR